MSKSIGLFEMIMNLRMSAAALYDKAKLMGLKEAEIAKEVGPLHNGLARAIAYAVVNDLDGCFTAVTALERHAEGLEKTAEDLRQKAQDDRHHASLIRQALKDRMKAEKLSVVHHGTHFATLVEHEGREILNLR